MTIFKNDFEKKWEELSNNIEKLNEYAKNTSVELRNLKVEDKILDGAIFTDATFDGVEWQNTSLEETYFTKTIFKNCKFINTKNWNSTLTDVLFENCTFYGVEFGGSAMVNVRFKRCKFADTRLKELTGNELVVEESMLEEKTSLAWSSIPMLFRKCTLDGVGLSGMKQPNSMTIEDSVLDEVDFSRGLFSSITFRRVKQGEGPIRFNSITADTLEFDDVDLTRGVGIAYSKVKLVKIVNGRFGAAFEGSTIAKVVARDVYLVNIDFSEAVMPSVSMNHCELLDLALWDSTIIEFSIMDSSINIANGKNFKGDTVVWDSVTLDGKIDFSNAKIEDFRPTRLKRGPKLNLITTGSNLKF